MIKRHILKNFGILTLLGVLCFAAGSITQADAADRILTINIPGNSLGVHIPYMAALNEILPSMQGYGVPKWTRVKRLQTITQSILTGSVEIGAGDAISTLRAVEAGADLRIIGNAFMHTSLVFVVNADKIKNFRDIERPDVTLAVNSKGDFTHVMLVGPLQKRGIDMKKVNVITMGGSSARMRALLAGKVDGVPLHFDQASDVAKRGNYKVMIEPAKEYDAFLGEVWIVSGKWLKKPENKRAAVDLLKATILAFRKANSDPKWYAQMYRKYGTKKSMKTASDEEIEVVRLALGKDIGCWPDNMKHSLSVYKELLPVYKSAGAVRGTVNVEKVVETRFVEQALKELQ
ncbi:MAG: ABC transporter substrate-binding protein [Deltaproteobacteria bacterium]|nr:ABC transporter substrate-binding protein [Deltaproteobacteria bacterium]